MVIVHLKILLPKPKALTAEVADMGFVILPRPDIKVQFPCPTTGVFAERFPELEQIICFGPAIAVLGLASTVMETSEKDDAQDEFSTVHLNNEVPAVIPVIRELGELGETMTPLPEMSDQVPSAATGVLAAIVVNVSQIN